MQWFLLPCYSLTHLFYKYLLSTLWGIKMEESRQCCVFYVVPFFKDKLRVHRLAILTSLCLTAERSDTTLFCMKLESKLLKYHHLISLVLSHCEYIFYKFS